MGFIKKKAPDQPKHGRLGTMNDDMLYTQAETQLMNAGYHLSRWRQGSGLLEVDEAILNAHAALQALEELASRG
jgi:hypothetical protein